MQRWRDWNCQQVEYEPRAPKTRSVAVAHWANRRTDGQEERKTVRMHVIASAPSGSTVYSNDHLLYLLRAATVRGGTFDNDRTVST